MFGLKNLTISTYSEENKTVNLKATIIIWDWVEPSVEIYSSKTQYFSFTGKNVFDFTWISNSNITSSFKSQLSGATLITFPIY